MRLTLSLFAILLVTAAQAAGPQDGPDGATVSSAARSVVQVIATGCPGQEGDRAGSGFVLDKGGVIVTDLHVVAGCTGYQVKYQGIDELLATTARVLRAP